MNAVFDLAGCGGIPTRRGLAAAIADGPGLVALSNDPPGDTRGIRSAGNSSGRLAVIAVAR